MLCILAVFSSELLVSLVISVSAAAWLVWTFIDSLGVCRSAAGVLIAGCELCVLL